VLDLDRPEPRATSTPERLMAHPLTDTPTTLSAAFGGPAAASIDGVLDTLADTSPIAVTILLLARQIVPALVLVSLTRGATPTQRIALLQNYLGATTRQRRRATAR
jgi:hypothetical protein